MQDGYDIRSGETKGHSEARWTVLLELLQGGADFDECDSFLGLVDVYTAPGDGKPLTELERKKQIEKAQGELPQFDGWLKDMNKIGFWSLDNNRSVIVSRHRRACPTTTRTSSSSIKAGR
jgi:hypothetical protein